MDLNYYKKITTKLKGKTGIYKLILGKRSYVGSAKNIYLRLYLHLTALNHNRHHNIKCQNTFNKHRRFSYKILEYCDYDIILKREQYWIDKLNPDLNIQRDVINARFVNHTPESKLKLSKIRKKWWEDNKHTEKGKDLLARMQKDRIGRKQTDRQKAAASKVWKGKKMPKEIIAKMSETKKRRFAEGVYGNKDIGETNPMAKLKEYQVLDIIERMNKGECDKILANMYDVKSTNISRIRKGYAWKHLTHLIQVKNSNSYNKLPDDKVLKIRRDGLTLSTSKVAKLNGVTYGICYAILTNTRYKHVQL